MKKTFYILILLLTACSINPPLEVARSLIKQSRGCCSNLSELPFISLRAGDTKKYRLDENTDSFKFKSGKSFFKAFIVEGKEGVKEISVKSYFSGDVLYPVVTILDSNFQVTRIISYPDISYKEPGWIEDGSIGGVFNLDKSKDETYFIVHTIDNFVGGTQTSTDSGSAFYSGRIFIYTPPSSYTHTYSYVGDIKVKVK